MSLMNTDTNYGECDCGQQYDSASRFDHDADSGQCWNCSDRNINTMSEGDLASYLRGE